MNRIDQLFQTKKRNILSVYFTAGFPQLNDTLPILESLQKCGVDMVEIGMPFSDPLADGPVIQHSSTVALKNGMSLRKLFDQLTHMREKIQIPIILMGYFNPVFRFGVENFCQACRETGIDGLILPDLPLDEYEKHYRGLFTAYGLHHILLVTPQTSDERIRLIDSLTQGFIYAVSTYSTTGGSKGIESSEAYFQRLQHMSLSHPFMIGFGIKDKQSFQLACRYASGAIVGTAFIKALEEKGNLNEKIERFVKPLLV